MLGLRDYVQKNGFEHVVLGLSGGIDSALVACLAVDALGAERVSAAIMPSRYSSAETQEDARALAARARRGRHRAADRADDGRLRGALARASSPACRADLTEENLQARIRGNLLMALSNKFGWLVLTTGNKSEMSVGYTTLYGDLAGGFAVIKDVPKTLVYRLCEWRNSPAGAAAARRSGASPGDNASAAAAGEHRSASRSPTRSSSGRPRPSCGPTSATRTRCPPTSCSTASCRATSSSTTAASS